MFVARERERERGREGESRSGGRHVIRSQNERIAKAVGMQSAGERLQQENQKSAHLPWTSPPVHPASPSLHSHPDITRTHVPTL